MTIKKMIFVVIFSMVFVKTGFALVITSPKNGDVFKEGDTVTAVAEKTPDDPKFAFVFFVTTGGTDKCPERITTHPRYECTFAIPPGSPPVININAVAVTADKPVQSPSVAVTVRLPSSISLREVRSFTGQELFFSEWDESAQLYIHGLYSDGIERDIHLGQAGTTYTSNNEKIVTVTADGLVTAIGSGKAQITVKNGDKKLFIEAAVQINP